MTRKGYMVTLLFKRDNDVNIQVITLTAHSEDEALGQGIRSLGDHKYGALEWSNVSRQTKEYLLSWADNLEE
jgi:hypothetical protein